MFDIPSLDAPALKPSHPSSSSQHSSGQVRSASSSGPIGRHSGSGPMPKKSSGPIGSSGGGRRSGQQDQASSIGKAVYGSAVTILNEEMNIGFRLSKALVWVFMVLFAMGLLGGVFLMVAVKKAVILVAFGGIAVPVLVSFVWN